MVDWERVELLRSKGWDWERIAADPKVGFHPDRSVHEPGRALRGLYHRQRSRGHHGERTAVPAKKAAEARERRWGFARVGILLTPVFGIWALLAYLVPSPVGLVLPAVPWLVLALAVAAFLLLFGLWRATGARWSKPMRSTLVIGVILGLVISGLIGIGGLVVFGCPYLPSAASATRTPGPGWTEVHATWQDQGRPVVYYFGTTWCPFCSASSWAIWKALTEFGSVSGAALSYSSPSDVYPSTPEVVLSGLSVSSTHVSFQVSEDTSGVEGRSPGTSNCYQQAYVSAYSGGAIPFLVVNGQYVHSSSGLVNPSSLSSWAGTGAATVQQSVASESGSPWTAVQGQAWWTMAFIAKSTGIPVSQLASTYHWSSATESAVQSDVSQLG